MVLKLWAGMSSGDIYFHSFFHNHTYVGSIHAWSTLVVMEKCSCTINMHEQGLFLHQVAEQESLQLLLFLTTASTGAKAKLSLKTRPPKAAIGASSPSVSSTVSISSQNSGSIPSKRQKILLPVLPVVQINGAQCQQSKLLFF